MSSLASKQDGSQIPGMEVESRGPAMNISVMLLALIMPPTMVIPQLAEKGLLLSKAWIWLLCLLESVPGMMGWGPLSTEKWKPLGVRQRIEVAKAEGAQDLRNECQNLGVLALWTEITMMATTEMNLLGVLQAVALPREGAGVAAVGVEGIT